MARWLVGFAVMVGGAIVAEGVRAQEDAAAAFEPATITVPAEYEVTLAAAPPLVKHPLMAGFDDRGRLYIAESAGENLRRAELEQQLPNFVRRLEDTNGDGVFDRSTIFADKLTLPQGALWHDGALYVAAPPSIWRLVDEDDDGVADSREELIDAFGYTGNAASIHGCFLGPAGRIHWCDGRHGHEVHDANGKLVSEGRAARIFSCRPDGSDFRVHCGGGMDNPVEIDFTEAGEMLGTVNLFYRQRGDCLVHWMHGGVYPRFDQACVDEFLKTGELLPEVHNLGHVAVSGMTRLRAARPENQTDGGRWLITQFNSHSLVETRLKRQGSTFAAEVRPFLQAAGDDFHPTDVLEDADGSVLVIDTGGWFRIGCPTSQIAKPNVLGAIYRIRRRDAAPIADPRGLQLSWRGAPGETLVGRLDDQRPAVRERATAALARGGEPAAAALAADLGGDVAQRRRRVWPLARNGEMRARQALRKLLTDEAWQVQLAAAAACGQLREAGASPALQQLLASDQPPLRREAATALGKIGDAAAVPALLDSLRRADDRVLEHAVIYALMEINDGAATAQGLQIDSPSVRRGALIALEQSQWPGLTQQMVASLLDTRDFALQAAAMETLARRPQWSDTIVQQLRSMLAGPPLNDDQRRIARGMFNALNKKEESLRLLVFAALSREELASADRAMLLEVIRDRAALPGAWQVLVSRGIEHDASDVQRAAVAAATAHPRSDFAAPLLKLASRDDLPHNLRISACDAWSACSSGAPLDPASFRYLVDRTRHDDNPLVRLKAASALGSSAVTLPQANELAELAAMLGPLELPPLAPAWKRHSAEPLGLKLVAALRRSPGADSLSLTDLEALLGNFPQRVQQAGRGLLESRRAQAAQRRSQQLASYEDATDGDPQRGGEVFFGRAAGCAACHRVSGRGGLVGPDLSTIGQRRSKRDLYEAVLFPNASLARGFETYLLRLHDGRQLSGLILGESREMLELRTTDQREARVPRAAIEAMKPSEVSVMPAGLQRTMSRQQLLDLVAYLKAQGATP